MITNRPFTFVFQSFISTRKKMPDSSIYLGYREFDTGGVLDGPDVGTSFPDYLRQIAEKISGDVGSGSQLNGMIGAVDSIRHWNGDREIDEETGSETERERE